MPVRGLKLVKQFRGVVRSDMRKALKGLTSLFNQNVKGQWMTPQNIANNSAMRIQLQTWLDAKVPV